LNALAEAVDEREDRIRRLANTDTLTGLAQRTRLAPAVGRERTTQVLDELAYTQRRAAVDHNDRLASHQTTTPRCNIADSSAGSDAWP
jgi:GGDEF domain-containing protein